jgi:uncharacterized surface protein with fasciclin (FAS1) repeats
MRKTIATLALAATAVGVAALPAAADGHMDEPNIVEAAIAANSDPASPLYEELDSLIAAVVRADLVGALSADRNLTVFAPVDSAFDAIGLTPDVIEGLTDEAVANVLVPVLLYHVAPGERFAADVVSAKQIRTLSKGFIGVKVDDMGAFLVDKNEDSPDAEIIATDVDVSNGVIHVIDQVLLPA